MDCLMADPSMQFSRHPPWRGQRCSIGYDKVGYFGPSTPLTIPVPKKRSLDQDSKERSKSTWPDVFIRLIDVVYELLQARNIIGYTLFVFTVILFIVAARSPQGSINAASSGFASIGTFLASEKFYIFPLGAALAFSVTTNLIQHRVYREHIKDLSEHRSYLVHGLQSGKLKPLKDHNSSRYED
jgi:hypothetical protein